MWRDVVVVRYDCRRSANAPRFMPLAMLTIKKELYGFLFLCMCVILFL